MRAAKNITILLLLITVLLAAKMFIGYPMLLDFSTDAKLVRTEDYSMGDTIWPFKHFDFSKGDWKAYILIHKSDNNSLPSEMGEGVLKTTDKHLLQCMKHTWKFIYTGGDLATVQSEIILYLNGILVFWKWNCTGQRSAGNAEHSVRLVRSNAPERTDSSL